MSIWKKFASLLFEESDTDIVAEDELEDISFPEEEVIQYKKSQQKQKVEKPHVEIPPVQNDVIHTDSTKEAPKEEVKKFISIEISEEKPKRKENETTTTRSRTTKMSVTREETEEFEFSPVISPIFGSKEENHKVSKNSSSMSITLPKAKKPNPLGTVISPYYGLGELEEFKAEAQETIEKNEKRKHEAPAIEELEKAEEEDDVNSLSLDDIIVQNDGEDEEDIMQISLFGETTPLRDSDHEANDYKKEV